MQTVEIPKQVSARPGYAGQRADGIKVVRRGAPYVVRAGKHLPLIAWALICLFPLVLVASVALSRPASILSNPYALFSSFTTANFSAAWVQSGFDRDFVNSVTLAVPAALIVVVVSLGAGYAFARCEFRGKRPLFYLVSLGLLLPFFTVMVPIYYELRALGLLNSQLGAVLVLATINVSFGVFLMRSFFSGLPIELEHAARIDGCTEWQLFVRIMVPLVRPGTLAVGAFAFLQCWTNFLVPLLYLTGQENQPLSLGLYEFLGNHTTAVGPMAAGTIIMIVPILAVFLVCQRRLLTGFLGGGVKA